MLRRQTGIGSRIFYARRKKILNRVWQNSIKIWLNYFLLVIHILRWKLTLWLYSPSQIRYGRIPTTLGLWPEFEVLLVACPKVGTTISRQWLDCQRMVVFGSDNVLLSFSSVNKKPQHGAKIGISRNSQEMKLVSQQWLYFVDFTGFHSNLVSTIRDNFRVHIIFVAVVHGLFLYFFFI